MDSPFAFRLVVQIVCFTSLSPHTY